MFKRSQTFKNCSSYKVLENNNFEIILIEAYPCKSKDELHKRERYWIENTECVNLNIPGRSDKEYREANKEIHKIYKINNKERIRETEKLYRENHKEKIKENNKKFSAMPPILCECGKYYTYKHN